MFYADGKIWYQRQVESWYSPEGKLQSMFPSGPGVCGGEMREWAKSSRKLTPQEVLAASKGICCGLESKNYGYICGNVSLKNHLLFMHYYLYFSALQSGQIKCQTQKTKMSMQKMFPQEGHQGITRKRPWNSPTPQEATPQEATPKTASPLPAQNRNVS